MKIKQSWKSIKLIARRQYPKIIYLVMSGSAQAIEPTHEQLLLDSAIDHSAAGRAFKCDPYAWIHTSGFAQRYGMPKRWLDYFLDSIYPARGINKTTDKTKSLDWVWLTAIDLYMLLSSDYFNLDDCHRVTRITKQQSE